MHDAPRHAPSVPSTRPGGTHTPQRQAGVEPRLALAPRLRLLQAAGPGALVAYSRTTRLALFKKIRRGVIMPDVMTAGMPGVEVR